MELFDQKQTGSSNTELAVWRRKSVDLLLVVASLCATVEMGFLINYYQSNPQYSINLLFYISAYLLTLILTIFKKIGYPIRALALPVITYCYGVVDLFSTGLSGDGRIILLAAPVLALLLSGPRSSEILTILSLITFFVAGFVPNLEFFPIQFIPQEASIDEFTWLSSAIVYATILIGLVTMIWQFARISSRTWQQNTRLASEGKALRTLMSSLQNREAELQALLDAVGDQVMVIDYQGRILKSAAEKSRSSQTVAEAHRKNILRILPQPQATEMLAQIQQSLDLHQTRIMDYCVQQNEEERWFSGTISPFEADKVVLVSRDITESIKSNSRERDQRTLANALKNAASLVNSPMDINEVLTRVLAAVGEVVPEDAASIILLGERGKISCLGRSGLPIFQKKIELLNKMNISDLQTLRTMKRTGLPLVIPDVNLYPAWVDLTGNQQTRSFIGNPIKIKGKVSGFLILESVHPDFYSNEHVEKLQSFIDLTATAIENANLQRETQKLAISDELTGLFNRRGLMDLGRREVDRAKRFRHPLAAVIIDLDNFKTINDTYGHVTGDQLLNQIADCCRASFREIDIICRYGGDEIVVLLIENDAQQAYQIADRFRQSIAGRVFRTDAGNLTTTVSIGVAALDEQTENLTQLIDQADRALYLAKEAGRNRIMAV